MSTGAAALPHINGGGKMGKIALTWFKPWLYFGLMAMAISPILFQCQRVVFIYEKLYEKVF